MDLHGLTLLMPCIAAIFMAFKEIQIFCGLNCTEGRINFNGYPPCVTSLNAVASYVMKAKLIMKLKELKISLPKECIE
jgi:hypothetical protein